MHPVLDRIVAELAGSVGKPGLTPPPAIQIVQPYGLWSRPSPSWTTGVRRISETSHIAVRAGILLRFCVGDFMLTSCAPSGLPSAARAILYH